MTYATPRQVGGQSVRCNHESSMIKDMKKYIFESSDFCGCKAHIKLRLGLGLKP